MSYVTQFSIWNELRNSKQNFVIFLGKMPTSFRPRNLRTQDSCRDSFHSSTFRTSKNISCFLFYLFRRRIFQITISTNSSILDGRKGPVRCENCYCDKCEIENFENNNEMFSNEYIFQNCRSCFARHCYRATKDPEFLDEYKAIKLNEVVLILLDCWKLIAGN